MNKYVAIILSVVLIFLSICGIFVRIINPIIKNNQYAKKVELYNANYEQRINDVESAIEQKKSNVTEKFIEVPTSDSQRVGMYIGKYVTCINNAQYAEAYELLADGFKKENFPTLEEFIEWVNINFPRKKSVEYIAYRLEGFTYIVDTKLIDWPIYDNPQTINKVFTFQEIESGKFVISFGI